MLPGEEDDKKGNNISDRYCVAVISVSLRGLGEEEAAWRQMPCGL